MSQSDKSYYYAFVEARDQAYTLKLNRQGATWLDEDFATAMKAMPEAFDKETEDLFFSFFNKYGTHFVHQVQCGGSLYYYTFVSDETKAKANMEAEYIFPTNRAKTVNAAAPSPAHWNGSVRTPDPSSAAPAASPRISESRIPCIDGTTSPLDGAACLMNCRHAVQSAHRRRNHAHR